MSSDSALAFFLATRDPEKVSREWTPARLEDVIAEALPPERAAALRRAALEVAASGLPEPGCLNGHPVSELRFRARGRRDCLACKRESARRNRAYKRARQEKRGEGK